MNKRTLIALLLLSGIQVRCNLFPTSTQQTNALSGYKFEAITFSQMPIAVDSGFYTLENFGASVGYGDNAARRAADSVMTKLATASVVVDTAWLQSGDSNCNGNRVIVFPQLMVSTKATASILSQFGFAQVRDRLRFQECGNITYARYTNTIKVVK
jgi:hypothetical protein